MKMIQAVSDCTKEKWSEVYNMNIYEFFNTYTFIIKDNKQKEEMLKRKRMI